jgi:hypothetical protein
MTIRLYDFYLHSRGIHYGQDTRQTTIRNLNDINFDIPKVDLTNSPQNYH